MGLKSPSRKTLYDVYSSDQGFLRYNFASNTASAPFAVYNDIENNLYSLLEKQTGEGKQVINTSFSVANMVRQYSTTSSNIIAAPQATVITSFSPTTVNAGALNDPINNVLTISGSGFGNTPGGSAAVNFTNADNDNSPPDYSIPYNSFYIVSWSNTKIVVKVPYGAATGNFSVVLNNGVTTATSPTPLTVFFGVLNFGFHIIESSINVDTIFVAEPRLMNTNVIGGYTYQFSTDTAGKGINFATDGASNTFNRAVATWKSLVGATLTAGGSTSLQKVSGTDGVNLVLYDNLNTGVPPMADGVLEATYSYGTICYSKVPFEILTAQKTGFDILLRNPAVSKGSKVNFENGPCFPAIGTYDVENVILHELGHALNLGHINDSYEITNGAYSQLNPGKIMHYVIVDYANRRTPDESAYQGALYTVTPEEDADYGDCLYKDAMFQAEPTVIDNDECPEDFPTDATPPGTVVNFDLVHATSNKHKDPAFTQVNGQNTGAFVTNNAYYAIRTSDFNNGALSIRISNYKTDPSAEASCFGQGVRMALYKVSACPVGQSFPAPVAAATFTGNGLLADITGLAGDANYLLYFDGLRNTKANFNVTLNGSALPIVLSNFTGEVIKGGNNLYIDIKQAFNVKHIEVEKSADGSNFASLGILPIPSAQLVGKHTYFDAQPFAGKNYYRLKVIDNDAHYQYSKTVILQNTVAQTAFVYPNPAKSDAHIQFSGITAGRYNCTLYNTEGKIVAARVYSLTAGNQTVTLPIGNVAAGVYIVRITASNGNTIIQQKLVKQ